jgi:alpha-galactosidase
MERVRLKLQPGESIRAPSIMLLFWRGSDRVRSQNLLRSLILKHYTPRPSGQPLQPPVAFLTWGMLSEEALVKKLDIIKNAGWPVDCFWVDAGWFGDCQRTDDWYAQAGNWHPNPRLFPNGLAPVAETAHRQGCKFLLWFDMERVYQNSELHREHPEWLIDLPPEQQIDPFTGKLGYRGNCLLNLGHPAARAWATNFLSAMISGTGIDILREDFNIDPLPFWRHADAPDRQGMTEIQYITGLYELLDELLKRHPHLTIDNCASGGRRLDLEMTRRSIPLWRSDLQCSIGYSALGSQSQTFGLASWLPLNCAGTRNWLDTYDFRSALSAGCAVCWPTLEHPDQEMAWAGKMLAEASLLRPLFQGDFYPLTQYSLSNDVWLAYQLNREDQGDGAALAYRREQAPYPCAILKLQSLERETIYELRHLDSGETREVSGGELMTTGLELKLNHAPDCAIVLYRKK